jgi:hypothetical protein
MQQSLLAHPVDSRAPSTLGNLVDADQRHSPGRGTSRDQHYVVTIALHFLNTYIAVPFDERSGFVGVPAFLPITITCPKVA